MEKNAILAILLSLAVLIGYSLLFPHQPTVLPEKADAPASQEAEEAAGNTEATPEDAPAHAKPAAAPVQADGAATSILPEKLVNISTPLYDAVVSTHGGVIKSWKLKQYTGEDGNPLDMVGYPGGIMPLTLVPSGVDWKVAQSFGYTADRDFVELTGKDDTGALTLSYSDPSGRAVTKKLTFNGATYAVGLDVSVDGIPGYTLYMGESFGSLTSKDKVGYGHYGFLTMLDGKIEKDEPKDLDTPLTYSGGSGWVGITDKYFIGALVSDTGFKAVFDKGMSDWGYVGVESAATNADYLMYAGPKDYDVLKSVGHGLDHAVDFGWFTFIAKPVFVALKYLHGLVGNYGWAIIIITFVIKLAFAPLTHKQQKSMKRMSALQPQINALKEKHKGDPQRMNAEMMDLYKKEKVNPLGGCLPMLVQIPVFIALYNVLNNAIELRHAPFALWLTDLSAKDPYYILPLLMGASMFLMQKMTPSTMDPNQAKIMMVLPVVMTVMFINLPSGLVLYFTVSNLLSMAQQFYINKSATA